MSRTVVRNEENRGQEQCGHLVSREAEVYPARCASVAQQEAVVEKGGVGIVAHDLALGVDAVEGGVRVVEGRVHAVAQDEAVEVEGRVAVVADRLPLGVEADRARDGAVPAPGASRTVKTPWLST